MRQQAQWAGQEVRTNLDLAFDDLNAAGIVARQDFTCCGTYGPRLTARGLDVEWNNDHGTRILVRGAQWYSHL
ncbi:hypothetical protein V6V89_12685 [Micromonospora sp. CPCC 206061]